MWCCAARLGEALAVSRDGEARLIRLWRLRVSSRSGRSGQAWSAQHEGN